MNGSAFKLGTFAKSDGAKFAAIVLGDDAIDLKQAHDAWRANVTRPHGNDPRRKAEAGGSTKPLERF